MLTQFWHFCGGKRFGRVYGRDFTTLMNDFIKSDLKLENTVISDGTEGFTGYCAWKPDDGYIPAGTYFDNQRYDELPAAAYEGRLPYLSMSHEPLAGSARQNAMKNWGSG